MNEEYNEEYNEYYYKINTKEFCNFFRIKYKFFDNIRFEHLCNREGVIVRFGYKTIRLLPETLKSFLQKKGYACFSMGDIFHRASWSGDILYGVKHVRCKQ